MNLTKSKANDLKVQLKRELCQESFYYFFKTFWHIISPEKPHWNWHIELICLELQIVAFRVRDRLPKLYDLIINVPPGSTKSSIATIAYQTWVWTIDPTQRIITTSHNQTLCTAHSRKSREIIESNLYQELFPEIVLKGDQNAKSRYENGQGGERYAVGITGSPTGNHAHQIIIDDPIDPMSGESEKERKTANDQIDGTFSTRKVDKGMTPTIYIMQRIHEADPTGVRLEKTNTPVRHICLPAELEGNEDIISPPECIAKYEEQGGYLDPVRNGPDALAESKEKLGTYRYAGQFDQRPAPAKGSIWQREYFIAVPDNEMPAHGQYNGTLSTDWDLAMTEKEENDASAYVTSGKIGHKIYIDDLGFAKKETPELIKWITSIIGPHYIENKGGGIGVAQMLNDKGITAIEISPASGDKVGRARMATPIAESGKVYIRASLLDRLLNVKDQGILKFPNNKNDDLQDALTQAIIRQNAAYSGWGIL